MERKENIQVFENAKGLKTTYKLNFNASSTDKEEDRVIIIYLPGDKEHVKNPKCRYLEKVFESQKIDFFSYNAYGVWGSSFEFKDLTPQDENDQFVDLFENLVLKAHDYKKVYLVGYSKGATTTTRLARDYNELRDRLAGVVAIGPFSAPCFATRDDASEEDKLRYDAGETIHVHTGYIFPNGFLMIYLLNKEIHKMSEKYKFGDGDDKIFTLDNFKLRIVSMEFDKLVPKNHKERIIKNIPGGRSNKNLSFGMLEGMGHSFIETKHIELMVREIMTVINME